MFNNKEKQEELPRAMRKMQKEKEEREKFIQEENRKQYRNKHKNNEKSKHLKRKGQIDEQNDFDYKKAIKKKKIKKIVITIIIIIIIILAIILAISAHNWKQLTTDMFVNENSIVIDSEGNTIANLGSERKKIKVETENMPENLKDAYVSIEDERYYRHHGVDIKRTGSAIINYVIHMGNSSFGGSTITQQLVKNLTGDNSSSISRKVKEWWKAYLLECYFSKEEILDMYLNVIYVGPNIYGVGSGAKYYFNKNVQELTLAECAFLAGINNSPNSYNPFTDETDNTEKINNRTKTVLEKMLELEYITEEEYNTAVAEVDSDLNFKQGTVESGDGIYSYHTDALINEIILENNDKYDYFEEFISLKDQEKIYVRNRSALDNASRKVDYIPPQELTKAVLYALSSGDAANENELSKVLSVYFGFNKSAKLTERIHQLVNDLLEKKKIYLDDEILYVADDTTI